MCREAKGRSAFPQRFRVGDITDGGYMLLSEGKDPGEIEYCVWVRSRNDPLCSIERIAKNNNGEWVYEREFACDILECATDTYLKLVNPGSVYHIR